MKILQLHIHHFDDGTLKILMSEYKKRKQKRRDSKIDKILK